MEDKLLKSHLVPCFGVSGKNNENVFAEPYHAVINVYVNGHVKVLCKHFAYGGVTVNPCCNPESLQDSGVILSSCGRCPYYITR